MINPGSAEGPLVLAAYNFMYWTSRLGEITLPLICAYGGFNRYREFNSAIQQDPSQYVASLEDMNPLKYPANALNGLLYLRGAGKQLIEIAS